jgi:hypothetical protein
MRCICANLRNKNVDLLLTGSKLKANEDELDIKSVYYRECSGTYEFFELVVELNRQWNKKSVLFFNISWLRNSTTSSDDQQLIDAVNASVEPIVKAFKATPLEAHKSFTGRVDGTFDITEVFFIGNVIIAPFVRVFHACEKLQAVFLERMSSYQKDFDITLCFESDVLKINSVNRKVNYQNVRREIFKDAKLYECGAEPLPWPKIMKEKKTKVLTYADIFSEYGADEEVDDDDDSDWEEDDESDEDDDAEFNEGVDDEFYESDEEKNAESDGEIDYPESESESESESTSSKKRKIM